MVDLTLFEFELKVLQGIPKMTTAMSRDDWNCFRNDFKRTSKGTQMKYRFCLPCGQIWSLKARLFLQLIILVLIWYSSLKTNDVYHQSTPMPPMISSNSTCFYSVRWFSWAFWCRPPCVCVCVCLRVRFSLNMLWHLWQNMTKQIRNTHMLCEFLVWGKKPLKSDPRHPVIPNVRSSVFFHPRSHLPFGSAFRASFHSHRPSRSVWLEDFGCLGICNRFPPLLQMVF